MARALRPDLPYRRAERHLLPPAHGGGGGPMARGHADGFSFRGERQPLSHAHEAPQGPRTGHRPVFRPRPPAGKEAVGGPLAASAADEQGGARAPRAVPREATATRFTPCARVPQRELVRE